MPTEAPSTSPTSSPTLTFDPCRGILCSAHCTNLRFGHVVNTVDRYELLPECGDNTNPRLCQSANEVTCQGTIFQQICGRACCDEHQRSRYQVDTIHECRWLTKVGGEGNPLALPATFHDGTATGWDSLNDRTRREWREYVENNAAMYLDRTRTEGLGQHSWGFCTAFGSKTLDFERDSYLANDYLLRNVHGCALELAELEIGQIEEILAEPCLSGRAGNITEDTSRTHCLLQERDRAREIRVLTAPRTRTPSGTATAAPTKSVRQTPSEARTSGSSPYLTTQPS
jgi:hypothetical protein